MALFLSGYCLRNALVRCGLSQKYISKSKFYSASKHLTVISYIPGEFCQTFQPILPVLKKVYRKHSYHTELTYSTKSTKEKPSNLDSLLQYETVSEETLQSLYERFEELLQDSKFADYDLNYSNDVLTIELKVNYTYVINKQTPNRQIWLSSPISGPKRYDYVDGIWIYKHDGMSLHQLLSKELGSLLETDANFITCTYSS